MGWVLLASCHLEWSAAVIWAATVNQPAAGFLSPAGMWWGVCCPRPQQRGPWGISGFSFFLVFLRSGSSRCQLGREGHLVLQMSFPWILPFLAGFRLSVKVSLLKCRRGLCSVSDVFGRRVRPPLPLQERRWGEEGSL